jgi:hypothetical protein
MHAAELYFNYDSQAAFIHLFNWLGFTEYAQPITHGVIEEITSVYTSVILKIILASSIIVFGKGISGIQLQYADALTTVLSGTIMSLQVLFYFALFVWKLALPLLVSMGAIIYGLPARFGRQAGAALIAMGLVFYVGLPFMPYYVGIFSIPECPRSAEIAALVNKFSDKIQDFNKKYGELGTVRWKVSPMGGPHDRYCIRMQDNIVMWTDENGDGEYPLPIGEYTYTITHFGDVGYTTGTVVITKDQTTDVDSAYSAWNFATGKESMGDAHPVGVTIEGVYGDVTVRIKCPPGDYVTYVDVTVNNKTTLANFNVEGDGVEISPLQHERSYLYEIPVDLKKYGNGTRNVNFRVETSEPTGQFPPNRLPHGEEMQKDTIAIFTDQFTIFRPMFDFSSAVLLTTIVLPITYLLILMQIGREVAKALGGRRMPLPEVT